MKKLLAVVMTVTLLCGCATLLGGPSDEESIQTMLSDWKAALESENLDDIMAFYSEDYKDEQIESKDELQNFIGRAIDQGYLASVDIFIEDAIIEVDGDTATAGPVQLAVSMSVKYQLKKEGKSWRIVGAEQDY